MRFRFLGLLIFSFSLLSVASLAQEVNNVNPEDTSVTYTNSPELQAEVNEPLAGQMNLSFRGGVAIGSEKEPAKSCKQIKDLRTEAESGIYWLHPDDDDDDDGGFKAYCNMERKGGGWTLLMNLNESEDKFRYSSDYWTNNETFNNATVVPSNGSNDSAAKFKSFSSVKGDNLMVTYTDPDHQIRYSDFSSQTAKEVFSSGENWAEYNNGGCTRLHDDYRDYDSDIMRFGEGAGGLGVNIDDNRDYGPIQARLIIGQDEDTTHSVRNQDIAIGTDRGSIYWKSDGGDSGDCGYYGSGYTPEDGTTTGSLWIKEDKTYTADDEDTETIDTKEISSTGKFSSEWKNLEQQKNYYWYVTLENDTYQNTSETWEFNTQSICDSRGILNQCNIEKEHKLNGNDAKIDSIMNATATGLISSLEDNSLVNVTNTSTISGIWTGGFTIDSSSPVITSGARFEPGNNQRIIINNRNK